MEVTEKDKAVKKALTIYFINIGVVFIAIIAVMCFMEQGWLRGGIIAVIVIYGLISMLVYKKTLAKMK